MIQLRDLAHSYGRKLGSGPIDLDIEDGTVLGLVDPNGSGKTSLLRAMCGIGTTSGTRLMDGRPLSRGISQDLTFAAAWAGSPRLILLDEPTNGLDTEAIFLLGDAISKRACEGGVVVLSAHVLSFLQGVCTRTVVLDGGRVVDDFLPSDHDIERVFRECFPLGRTGLSVASDAHVTD